MAEPERFTLDAPDDAPVLSEAERLRLRRALGRWPTGVAIATCGRLEGPKAGLTINSFASVSLEPPLVLWSLAKTASVTPAFLEAPHFAINVLEAGQEALARRFAEVEDRFAGIALEPGIAELPLIPGAIAVFECRREAVHPGGDHWILVGRVLRVTTRPGRALAFHQGMFRELA